MKLSAADKPEFDPIKEANLSGHLSNPTEKINTLSIDNTITNTKGGASEKGKNGNGKQEMPLIKSDYQLYEALNLLKGVTIMDKNQED